VFQQTTAKTPSKEVAIVFFVKTACIYFLSGDKTEERDDEKAGFSKERFVARVGCERLWVCACGQTPDFLALIREAKGTLKTSGTQADCKGCESNILIFFLDFPLFY
jgi:hypothetical protein